MKIAVLIPCLNEEASVGKVVADSFKHLPSAKVYVFDNGSNDSTSAVAAQAGATVIHCPLKGKGHVLRQAFQSVDADWYVMVDGDGTYPMHEAPRLLKMAQEFNYEMVMGSRLLQAHPDAFRRFHYFGNRLFTRITGIIFRYPVRDLLTGFRVFSRRFATEMNLLSKGFEIETEITIRAIEQHLPFTEIDIPYTERVAGSSSKLKTFRDGFRITKTILRFWMYFHPLTFFTWATFLSWSLLQFAPRSVQFYGQNLPVTLLLLGFYWNIKIGQKRMQRLATTRSQPSDRSLKEAA